MKKTLILSTQPISQDNHSAFVRTSLFLQKKLQNVNLIDRDFEMYREPFDNIIVAYGTFYADFKKMMMFLEAHKDKRLIYMINEYGLVPNGDIYRFLIKNNYDVIANYVEGSSGAKHYKKWYIINTNISALKEISNVTPFANRPKDLIYWGRYRPDREEYFKKYLHDCIVSTSQKNEDFFLRLKQKIKLITTVSFDENSFLNLTKFTIYIEDKYTHTHYNHLADRFYEALSFGIIMFFDMNAKNTVKQSGYDISDFYFVKDYKDLKAKMEEVNKDPEFYLKNLERLKEQAKKEQEESLKEFDRVLQLEQELPTIDCPTCNSKAYSLKTCVSCSKKICSNCFQIHKKFYCKECFDKVNTRVDKQMTLF